MFLYFLVIPFILPFASRLVEGDGWAVVETETFLLYSQGRYCTSNRSAYTSCTSPEQEQP